MGSYHKHLKSHLHTKTVLKEPHVYIFVSATMIMITMW